MAYLLILCILLALCWGPQWWVRRQLRRYGTARPDLPGSGGELALHLVKRFELRGVKVDATTPGGDHYNPRTRAVCLSPQHLEGRSLAAVAAAAHEVGHAMQHQRGDKLFTLRYLLVSVALQVRRLAALLLVAAPIATLLLRQPILGLLLAAAAFLCGALVEILVHLVTLPVEWDASFGKALPVLRGYLSPRDLPAVRKLLRACALSYLAAALANMLNLWAWIALLRRWR